MQTSCNKKQAKYARWPKSCVEIGEKKKQQTQKTNKESTYVCALTMYGLSASEFHTVNAKISNKRARLTFIAVGFVSFRFFCGMCLDQITEVRTDKK